MATKQYRTHVVLWLALTGLVFFGLGWLSLTKGVGKGDNRYWIRLHALLTGEYTLSTGEYILTMIAYTGVLMVPSLLLGWVFQAMLVLGWKNAALTRRSDSAERA